MIDYIEHNIQGEKVGIAYAYFDYNNQAQQSALNVVASLAKQLVSHVDDILPDLYRIYKALCMRNKSPDLEDFLQALRAASKALQTSFIVFDALNECEPEQRRILLDFIRRLPTSESKFKVFATSRPYLREIEEFFDHTPKIKIISDTQDIKTYLNKRMERERSVGLKSEVVETLTINANSLYASLEMSLLIAQVSLGTSSIELCSTVQRSQKQTKSIDRRFANSAV